jgi:hypothetical protein
MIRIYNRMTRGAAIAWGIWTPRTACAWGAVWWLCGYDWAVVPPALAMCIWVAFRFDRPIQRRLRLAWEAEQREATHA